MIGCTVCAGKAIAVEEPDRIHGTPSISQTFAPRLRLYAVRTSQARPSMASVVSSCGRRATGSLGMGMGGRWLEIRVASVGKSEKNAGAACPPMSPITTTVTGSHRFNVLRSHPVKPAPVSTAIAASVANPVE